MKISNMKRFSLFLIFALILYIFCDIGKLDVMAEDNNNYPTVYSMNIGTTPLYVDKEKGWNKTDGTKVYFGHYQDTPTLFRVLGTTPETQSVTEGNGILLNSDKELTGSYMSYRNSTDSNEWQNSSPRAWLAQNYYQSEKCFSAVEKSAIMETSLKEISSAYTVNGHSFIDKNAVDNIFLLSAKEASELYASDTDLSNGAHCWLRSSDFENNGNVASFYGNGEITSYDYSNPWIRVSPAFNLNSSSVLFTNCWEASKSSFITADSSDMRTTQYTGEKIWKLTLKDTKKSIKIMDGKSVEKTFDGKITIPYDYCTNTDNEVNQVSVMITDDAYDNEGAKILYYGKLDTVEDSSYTSGDFKEVYGSGTFTLPNALSDKKIGIDYHLYIIAEHVNDDNATDYAGLPREIFNIVEEVGNVKIDVPAPIGGDELAAKAKCSILGVNSDATSVKWIPNDIIAEYNTVYTVSITLDPTTSYKFSDDTSVTVNGDTANSVTRNVDGKLIVTYTFAPTATKPTPPTEPVAGNTSTSDYTSVQIDNDSNNNISKSEEVATGDEMNYIPWVVLMVISMTVAGFVLFKKREKQRR